MHKGITKELCHIGREKLRRLIEMVTVQNNLQYIRNKMHGQSNQAM